MKPRITSMFWNIRKQKTTNQNNKRKKNPKKNDNSISNLWDNFKRSNICFIGVPEGEEKEQEIGNLSEQIMKENFPNLVKEIVMARPGCRESQTRWRQRGPHQDTI